MNTRQELKGSLEGIDALVLIYCGQICKIFIVNWHGVKYPKRGLGNIQVRGTGHEQCAESYSIFGLGREKHFTHTNFTPLIKYSPFSLRCELAVTCDEQWAFWVRTTQRQLKPVCVAPSCCFHCCLCRPFYTEVEPYCHTEDLSLKCLCLKSMQHNEIPLWACSSEASLTFILKVRHIRGATDPCCVKFSLSWLSCCYSVSHFIYSCISLLSHWFIIPLSPSFSYFPPIWCAAQQGKESENLDISHIDRATTVEWVEALPAQACQTLFSVISVNM